MEKIAEIEELVCRLTELQERGAARFFPEDLLEQLAHSIGPEKLTDPDVVENETAPAEGFGLVEAVTYKLGLHRIFLYEPDHLLVAEPALDSVLDYLRDQGLLADGAGERNETVLGYTRLRVRTTLLTVPAIALKVKDALGLDATTVVPNHVLTAGKAHAGGSSSSPNNRVVHHTESGETVADHLGKDLEPLAPPTGDGGAGCTIAVIDSGILPSGDLPAWMWTNVSTFSAADIEADYFDVVDGEHFVRHPRAHGTFVIGILRQLAPGARILVKRVLDKNGLVTDFEFGRALKQVLENPDAKPDLINCSLGCSSWTDDPPPVLAAALALMVEQGVVMVAAAGNGATTQTWPAASPDAHVVGVGSVNRERRRSRFSNFGAPVKVWALGEEVTSVYATGVFARPSAVESMNVLHRPFAGLAAWSGTSFAAPRVTALIATALHDHATVVAAMTHVLETAEPNPGHLPEGATGFAPVVTSGLPPVPGDDPGHD